MKKGVWIPLVVVGSVLLAAGGMIFAIGLANSKDDTPITKEYEVADYSKINIDIGTADLEFVVSESQQRKVVCQEREKLYHTVEVKDDTLNIKGFDSRNWYERIFNISWTKMRITVFAPAEEYAVGSIRSATGNIAIPHDYSFGDLDVDVSTGNIDLKCEVEGNLGVESATGDISIESGARSIIAKSSTGNQAIKCIAADEVRLESSTGDISLEGNARSVFLKTSTGRQTLNSVMAEEITNRTSTGDVSQNDCDASSLIDIETSTGDVKLSLLSGKTFDIETSTGNKDVPASTLDAPLCKIKTSTGNIKVVVNG